MARRTRRGSIQNLDAVLQGLETGRKAALAVSAQCVINSDIDRAADIARKSIDDLAEILTGKAAYFAEGLHST